MELPKFQYPEIIFDNTIYFYLHDKPDSIIMLSLSEDGFRAYQEQRFHSISASLFEAKNSRELAIAAIVIAIISVFI